MGRTRNQQRKNGKQKYLFSEKQNKNMFTHCEGSPENSFFPKKLYISFPQRIDYFLVFFDKYTIINSKDIHKVGATTSKRSPTF